MKRATKLFGAAAVEAVETAIAAAEQQTGAEIVPVVASVSGRYDRAEDLFGVCCALGALAVAWILGDAQAWTDGSTIGLGMALAAVVVGFIIGTVIATKLTVLRLPFISRAEMLEEVERRALETFQRQRVRDTANSSGVLIYVSLYEHLVKVIADDHAASKLPDHALDSICAAVVDGLKQGNADKGLVAAIAKTGEVLAHAIPPDTENHLPNQLILID